MPSIAIKVFRDGQLSANMVALNTEQPQTATTNPFFLPLTNQVSSFKHTRNHCRRTAPACASLDDCTYDRSVICH